MKKGLLFILFLFIISPIYSQIIKGKVTTTENENLEGASVYFNNTTIGTITDEKGEFSLKIDDGNYDLTISFLGFKTQQIKINTINKNRFLNIKLVNQTNILNEVFIEKTKYDDDWKYNLSRFKQAFLGRSKLADDCIILNEKTLHFYYNIKTQTLTARTKEPLRIKHKSLGYLITYDLVNFNLVKNRLSFTGYARYENLKKSIKNKWKKNRLEAYKGSQVHFLRSLLNRKLENEGFIVNQFKRVLNPDRPSDQEIKLASEFVKLSNTSNDVNLSKKISQPKTPLDKAIVILQKKKLPKYNDYLYKRNVEYENMCSFLENNYYLNFNNHLSIIYTKESEEDNYLIGMFGQRKKATGMQTSNIVLLEGKVLIDKFGIPAKPNSLFNEGYWGFESFANMLPLNYMPSKN